MEAHCAGARAQVRIRRWATYSALAPLLGLWPCAAQSQQVAAAAAPPGVVEEVIVTAQKRSERLQDVPLSVTAITSNRVAAAGVTSTFELQELVPGLVSNQKTTNSQPYLRGLGVGQATPGFDSSVSTYIDDVYMPNAIASSFNLNSIERVEVLKGPQGTLFGRNSSAGVVALFTDAPSSTPALRADVSYGNYETVTGRLYATGALGQGVAANLAVYANNQAEGWGKNIVTGQDFHTDRSVNARTKLRWDIDPKTDLQLTAWYVQFTSNLAIFRIAPGTVAAGPYACTGCGFFDVATSPNVPDHGGETRGTNYGGSAKLNHDLDSVRLTNIFAYQVAKPFFDIDADATPANLQESSQQSTQSTLTNETQIVSTGGGKLKWTLGFFYLHDILHFNQTVTGTSSPAGSVIHAQVETNSYAPFAQASYEVADKTNLTLGLRYTSDRRERSGVSGNLATQAPVASLSATFSDPSWRVALDHKFDDDVMGYLSYSRGFKAGLLNVAELTGPAVRPETVDAYEIGLKSQFLDRRLQVNVAAFYNNIRDLQLRALVGALGISVVTNAASARTYGVDVDFDAAATRQLHLSGGFELLDATFENFPAATFSTPRPVTVGGNTTFFASGSGRPLPYAAKFSGNLGAQYTIPLGDHGDLKVAGNYSYHSRVYFEPDPRISQSGYGLVNGSVAWATRGPWEVSVWAHNLTDTRYASSGTVALGAATEITPGAPRTYGVTLGVRF